MIGQTQNGAMPSLEDLQRQGVKNLDVNLPTAPCVKHKKTGMIYPWHKVFANRGDIFVCCDADGREEEVYWVGQPPLGSTGNRVVTSSVIESQRYEAPKTQPYAATVVGQKFVAPEF
jgi:hypothetical protein